jgi:hypothetical protein
LPGLIQPARLWQIVGITMQQRRRCSGLNQAFPAYAEKGEFGWVEVREAGFGVLKSPGFFC